MATTKTEIKQWLNEALKEGATHVIIVCDTYDYDDYPVSVMPNENVREVYDKYDNKNMQRVMEVYALHLPIDAQLSESRSYHFEVKP